MAGTSHRNLVVWQLGIDLVVACYELTRTLPSEERFGLISQMRRAAISVPSNISEGHARRSRLAYAHHVSIALGSQSELETLITICRRLNYASPSGIDAFERDLQKIGRLLFGLHRSLSAA